RSDLNEQRFVPDHTERRQDVRELARRQLAVLLRQRVDGRLDDVHRDPEAALESRQREDRGVVLVGELPEEGPGGRTRRRAVEMAAPDPPAVGPVGHEARRLDVVDQDEVGVERELLGVHPVHLDPVGEPLVAEHPLRALQRRLERARGRIVGLIAPRDLPARVDAQVAQDRDGRAEALGYAAAPPTAGQVAEPSSRDAARPSATATLRGRGKWNARSNSARWSPPRARRWSWRVVARCSRSASTVGNANGSTTAKRSASARSPISSAAHRAKSLPYAVVNGRWRRK